MPTSAPARFRARNGGERGGPSTLSTPPAPACEPLAALRSPPPQSGALFSLPTRNCHSASGVHQTLGSALGTVPTRGLWRFCARRIRTPTSAHAHFRAGNGGERGGPSMLSNPPCSPPAASCSTPPQSGALFSLPPRNCHSASGVQQTLGPALGTVPARGLSTFCAHRIRTPTRAHADFRAGNGGEWGGPSTLSTLPCSRSRTPSRIAFPAASVRGSLLVTTQKLPQRQRGSPDKWPSPWHGARPQPVEVLCSQDSDAHQLACTL